MSELESFRHGGRVWRSESTEHPCGHRSMATPCGWCALGYAPVAKKEPVASEEPSVHRTRQVV